MRIVKSGSVLLLVFLVFLATPGTAEADMSIAVEGGGLGQPFVLELSGPAGGSYLLIMSTNTGPTTTPWVTLDVGLELLNFSTLIPGFMDYFDGTGHKTISLVAPSDPVFDGLNLNFQNCLLDQTAPPILEVSNLYRVTFALPNSFAFTLENAPDARSGAAAAGLPDGRVLIAGGTVDAPVYQYATNTILLYDPALERFETAPFTLPAPRTGMTAVELADGRVLFLGGLDPNDDPTNTAWVFDPDNAAFTAAAPMSKTRLMFQAVRLADGRVLVIGGFTDNTDELSMIDTLQKSTELFDPATLTFSPGPDMAKARAGFTATLLGDGRVLAAGGISYYIFLGLKIPEILDKAELYTPSAGGPGAFGTPLHMTRTCAAHAAHLLPDGRVLIAGGATGSFVDYAVTGKCELFDPAGGGAFSATGALEEARALCTTVTRPDGTVIAMAGGQGDLDNPVILGTCEVFDPATGTWSGGPGLKAPRFAFAFAPLPDGTFLLAGGLSGNPSAAVFTAEVYQP